MNQQRVLIIGPGWIGDTIMAQSLFKLLKQINPAITIDVLAPPHTLPLLHRMAEVNNALLLPFKHGELGLTKRYHLAKNLQLKNYQQAIVLPNSFKSALIPWFANIPKRTGWRGELRWGVLNDLRVLDKKQYPLMVQRYTALGIPQDAELPQQLPWPELRVSPASPKLRRAGHKAILALCPGAAYGPAKRWPKQYFAEVAKTQHAAGWEIWLLGGPQDQELTAQIQKLSTNICQDFAGKTSLEESIDRLAAVDAVVTNDSGLMHIAAAVKVPQLIAIYGSSSPDFTPPLTDKVTILTAAISCRPCFKRTCRFGHYRCLADIKPQQVCNLL